ncbi:hypothetical protein [Salinispira pacifica]|uniref:DUF5723 domain-containing protein n=1 Tax=Salinispira pacifica TaxID=1307761 RepID=V5WG04_9SPIO|nr:hypothetical protein [Salinispira pacifica]AHC14535.1 hypothetical protein L21SP2_1132 [Salinispira pacifica]
MKKTVLLITAFLLVSGAAFAQLDPFMPPNPITFAQGGAFTANAEGMNSFFYNPAGFRHEKGELTLTSVGVYAMLDRAILDLAGAMLGGSPDGASFSTRQSGSELPSELQGLGLDELFTEVEDVAAWLGEVGDADPDAGDAAVSAALDEIAQMDPSLADDIQDLQTAIENGEEVSTEQLTGAILSSPIFEENEETGNSNLTEIIKAMDKAAGEESAKNGTSVPTADDSLGDGWEDSVDAAVAEAKESIPSGQMRFGALAGIAYSGNGLGLGLFVNVDGTFNGDTILSTRGRVLSSVTAVGGLSFPVGPFSVGAQLRPTILGYADVNPSQILMQQLGGGSESEEMDIASIVGGAVYSGLYIGLDAGALYDLGPFTFGLTVKDLLPIPVQWSSHESVEQYAAALSGGALLGGEPVDDASDLYKIPPMKVNVGAQFNPDLGPLSWIVDPRVNVDIHDLFGFLRYINEEGVQKDKATYGTSYNFVERLHVGAEAAFLGGLASVRGGFYGDFLNAGLGIHLLFLDINAGVGLSQLEKNAAGEWVFKQLGLSAEVAIRF